MSNNVINTDQVFWDATGAVRAFGVITFFNNNTTDEAAIFSDSDLTVTQANPYTLDAYGRMLSDVTFSGLLTLSIANEDGSDVRILNNVATTRGIFDEWITPLTAIRTSTTTFTVVGDQTAEFMAERRLKCTGGADRYTKVSSSVFTTLTTVTVKETTDNADASSTLHASMDTVYTSIISRGATTGLKIYEDLASTTTDDAINGFHLVNYPPLTGEIGATNYEYYYGDPKRHGAAADGVTDDSTAMQNAFDSLTALGGISTISPGTYLLESQVTVTSSTISRLAIFAYGAIFTTTGAISGLKITGGDPNGGVSVHGLTINHRGNNDATYGFEIPVAWNARLYDCTVEAHGVNASYAAYAVFTSSFWTTIENCWCRKRSGGDAGDITVGVLIQGNCNATTIRGGGLNSVTTGILHQDNSAVSDDVANALLVDGVNFEAYGTAYHANVPAGEGSPTGLRIVNCRFESGTTVFSFTGTTVALAVPPYLSGNYMIFDAGTYLNNPNNIVINSFDISTTPDITGEGMVWKHRTRIIAEDGSDTPFDVIPGGGGRGIRVMDTTDTFTAVHLTNAASATNRGLIKGEGTGTLGFGSIRGLSSSSTEATNFKGTVTFSTSGTSAVTFGTAEPNTSYEILIGATINETFWVTSKATGGFTMNSSNASSTATVSWLLVR